MSTKNFKAVTPVDSKDPAPTPPGPTFRGITFGPEYAHPGDETPTGWAVYYVETQDGKVVLSSKLDDAGPKNVAQETAKIALVRKVLLGNWE